MTNKKLKRALALVALASLAVIAGCGGDDSAETSLTKAQVQKKANLICNAASNEQFKLANNYLKKNPKAKEEDLVGLAGIPPLEKELEELEELPVSGDLEDQIDAFLEEFEKGLAAIKDDPDLALSAQDNPFEDANALAKKYKLGDCSDTP